MTLPQTARSDTAPLEELGITVFERGWLSSNNVLFTGSQSTALVDSGYSTHARQTLDLVREALDGRPLDLLLNTHLHSDHCGGNAALQTEFPSLQTRIPPGQAASVAHWDPIALTYEPTGQTCPSFAFQGLLSPGTTIQLGDNPWEIHAATGHDPHSVILFEPRTRVLISADALWENGFGIVFPELEGLEAFDEVAGTLDLIETLGATTIVPGHGPVFDDAAGALRRARRRLEQFVSHPEQHRRHALKVLIKFKLLEWQSVNWVDLLEWYVNTPYIALIEQRNSQTNRMELELTLDSLIRELTDRHAVRREADRLINV